MSIRNLIKWLESKEAIDLRGCDICTHLDEPYDVIITPGQYGGTIFGPCMVCDHTHNCFMLDEKRLEENVELGLTSKRTAKKIRKQQAMCNADLLF